jgi:hypothetical protein
MNWNQTKFKPQSPAFRNAPSGKKLFDSLIVKSEQEKWENSLDFKDLGGIRIDDVELRDKYRKRYEAFLEMPEAKDVMTVLNEYITTCIPFPVKTETNFWSCSCLPGGGNKNDRVLARININWQEVFTICLKNERLLFSFHVARTPLEEILNNLNANLIFLDNPDFSEINLTSHMYVPGGFDQIHLEGFGVNNAIKVLKNEYFLKAARLFNLRLMKRGRNAYSNSHCLALTDNFLEQPQ